MFKTSYYSKPRAHRNWDNGAAFGALASRQSRPKINSEKVKNSDFTSFDKIICVILIVFMIKHFIKKYIT